jgi:hypothetical protein
MLASPVGAVTLLAKLISVSGVQEKINPPKANSISDFFIYVYFILFYFIL